MRDRGSSTVEFTLVSVLLVGLFFLSMMVGVRSGLSFYTLSYFWQLSNDQIGLFVIGSFAGYAFAATVDKRWTGAFAVMLYAVGPALAPLLGWLGVISHETAGIMWIVMGLGALGHMAFSLMTTTVYSALADIADENELRYGIRQEGVLYSTRTFFQRIDQARGRAHRQPPEACKNLFKQGDDKKRVFHHQDSIGTLTAANAGRLLDLAR